MEKDLLFEIGMDEEEEEEEETEDNINTQLSDEHTEEHIVDTDEVFNLRHQVEISITEGFNDELNQKPLFNSYDAVINPKNIELSDEARDVVPELADMSIYSDEFDDDDFDGRSIRSGTSATTIAPEDIRKRTKVALLNRERKEKKKNNRRKVAKGEANATTRTRRANRDEIKNSEGIWG